MQQDWTVRPGYSSGASSFGGSDVGDDDFAALSDSELIGLENELVLDRSRHSDTLALGRLQQEIRTEGNLAGTVVRIETPFGKPIEEIYDGVHEGPVLGSGVSGIVRLISHRDTGLQYAVKILDLGKHHQRRPHSTQADQLLISLTHSSGYFVTTLRFDRYDGGFASTQE